MKVIMSNAFVTLDFQYAARALAEILEDSDLADPKGPSRGAGPAHAARLLGVVGGEAAIEPLVRCVCLGGDLSRAAGAALARIGGASVDALMRRFQGQADTTPEERVPLATALVMCGRFDAAAGSRIRGFFRDELRRSEGETAAAAPSARSSVAA